MQKIKLTFNQAHNKLPDFVAFDCQFGMDFCILYCSKTYQLTAKQDLNCTMFFAKHCPVKEIFLCFLEENLTKKFLGFIDKITTLDENERPFAVLEAPTDFRSDLDNSDFKEFVKYIEKENVRFHLRQIKNET